MKSKLLTLHTDAAAFGREFSPALQGKYCADRAMCMKGTAPTLEAVAIGFGMEAAITWIAGQIYELSEYCGVRQKITVFQIHALSKMIAEEYKHIKVTEFMLFCNDFKMAKIVDRKGDTIGFYGSVAPDIIAKALKLWEDGRKKEIRMYACKRPSVNEVVDDYRHRLKNAIWERLHVLNHSTDESEKERIEREFEERGIDKDDYWPYIDRKTYEYRKHCEKVWNEKYAMPWR